mgnify:CR=1 FL=1
MDVEGDVGLVGEAFEGVGTADELKHLVLLGVEDRLTGEVSEGDDTAPGVELEGRLVGGERHECGFEDVEVHGGALWEVRAGNRRSAVRGLGVGQLGRTDGIDGFDEANEIRGVGIQVWLPIADFVYMFVQREPHLSKVFLQV